jgi:hypothetical protein
MATDLLIATLTVCGVVLLYSLQFLAGHLGSINLWFCDAIFYYCLCPSVLVTLAIRGKRRGSTVASDGRGSSFPNASERTALAVSILLMASVCTPFAPLYVPFTRGYLARMKSEVDPHQLQIWALGLIKTRRAEWDLIARSTIEHIEPHRDKPPECIERIRGYENPNVGVGTRDGQWEVSLLYGGGMKGWGLFIGDPSLNLQTTDTLDTLYVVQWVPGVFAAHTR